MLSQDKYKSSLFFAALMTVSLAVMGCDSKPTPTPTPSPSPSQTQSSNYTGVLKNGIYVDNSTGAFLDVEAGSVTFNSSVCGVQIPFAAPPQVIVTEDGPSYFGAASIEVNLCNQGFGIGVYGGSIGSTGNAPTTDALGIPYSILDCMYAYNFAGVVNSDGSIDLDMNSTLGNSESHVMAYYDETLETYLSNSGGYACPGAN